MTAQDEFKAIAQDRITRDGIGDLMKWLDDSDFYTAPASTRYHGAHEGGLVEHSLNVYKRLRQLAATYDYGAGSLEAEWDSLEESIAIVSLFHDLCKVGYYTTEMRWRKDQFNRWEQYPTYKKQENYPFGGHGSKSVYLVQHFMKLKPEEASAINCHMGAWDKSDYGNPSEVYDVNLLAWLLHVADEAATYINKC